MKLKQPLLLGATQVELDEQMSLARQNQMLRQQVAALERQLVAQDQAFINSDSRGELLLKVRALVAGLVWRMRNVVSDRVDREARLNVGQLLDLVEQTGLRELVMCSAHKPGSAYGWHTTCCLGLGHDGEHQSAVDRWSARGHMATDIARGEETVLATTDALGKVVTKR